LTVRNRARRASRADDSRRRRTPRDLRVVHRRTRARARVRWLSGAEDHPGDDEAGDEDRRRGYRDRPPYRMRGDATVAVVILILERPSRAGGEFLVEHCTRMSWSRGDGNLPTATDVGPTPQRRASSAPHSWVRPHVRARRARAEGVPDRWHSYRVVGSSCLEITTSLAKHFPG